MRIETFDDHGNPVFDSVLRGCGEEGSEDTPICHIKDAYTIKLTFPLIDLVSDSAPIKVVEDYT